MPKSNFLSKPKQSESKKKMHLLGFVLNGLVNHTQSIWANSRHHRGYEGGFAGPTLWQSIGRTLERGKFDAIFIADVLAPYTNFKGNSDSALRYAVQCPVHDPAALVPVISTVTSNLGIGLTLSTSFVPPYHVVRQLSTLEHLTGYRVGWNIVTSYARAEFAAMGLDMMIDHDERYERADEFLKICYALWDAWEDGAIVRDEASAVFVDPSKVQEVAYEGRFMKCRTRPITLPLEPHRRPVLWQAGGSKSGREFAARHSDSVFHVAPTAAAMKAYSDDMRIRFERNGRDPEKIKIIFGLQVFVGETRAEAQHKYDEILHRIPLEATLTIMSGHFGLDFSRFDPDEDMRTAGRDPAMEGAVGQLEAIMAAGDPNKPLTIRNAAEIYGISAAAPILIGTPSDIADQMEQYFDDGGGDGFMIFSTYLPSCYAEFVELVVPELQRRDRFRAEYSGSTLRHHLTEY